ncbi:MAG: phosphoribosylanthranilate isomerase [Rikenellaceae bacterium]
MIGDKIIKVCGMREGDNILAVEMLGVDLMGFIFYPKSPRYISSTPSIMPTSAKRVGVFVNESMSNIVSRVESFNLDYVQLHGAESVDLCRELSRYGVKVIKAFSIDSHFDFHTVGPYLDHCDLFVFDTKCDSVGGSGRQFNWSQLHEYSGKTPFLLSGGISADSSEDIAKFEHPQLVGYDLNSCFESAPAMKDVELLKLFFEKLKLKYE